MCYAFSVSAFQICIIGRNTWRRWFLIRHLSIQKKHQLQVWKNVANVCSRDSQYQNWNPYFTTKKLLISVIINLHKAKGGWIGCDIFSSYICQTEHCFISGIFSLCTVISIYSLKSFRQYWKLDSYQKRASLPKRTLLSLCWRVG